MIRWTSIVLFMVATERCNAETTVYSKKLNGSPASGFFLANSRSAIECASQCSRNSYCSRFTFIADKKECRYFNNTMNVAGNGASTYGNTDECASGPCRNGGKCTNEVSGYTCQCQAGYSGSYCETDTDECASNPCHNTGSCVDAVNGYTCQCQAGYSGSHCETDTDECASNPCHNTGSCVDAVNGYTCQCQAGYSGSHCETDIDECGSNPCDNGGVCTDGANGYTCQCQAGYTGNRCQTNTDECASDPCQNGGVCTDGVNGYTCQCQALYIGSHCETELCPSNLGYAVHLVNSNNRCLKPNSAAKSYANAKSDCLSANGHLYTLDSMDGLQLIFVIFGDGLFSFTSVWIDGGTELQKTGGGPLPWTSWAISFPFYPRANECPAASFLSLLYSTLTHGCTNQFPYMCQIDI